MSPDNGPARVQRFATALLPVTSKVGRRLPAAVLRRDGGRLHRRRRRAVLGLVAIDVAMLAFAVGASALGAAGTGTSLTPVGWTLLYAALTISLIAVRGGYLFRLAVSPFEYAGQVLSGTAIAAMVIITARVVLAPDPDLSSQVVRLWGFASVYLLMARLGLSVKTRSAHHQGRSTLIIGAGEVGRLVGRRLLERPELGLRPIGFLDKAPREETGEPGSSLPVLGASWDLEEVIERHDVEHVIVSFSTAPHAVVLGITRRCRALGVEVSIVPRLFEEMSRRIRVEHLGGVTLLRVDRVDPRGWQFEIKYAVDRLLGALLLVLALPVLMVMAVAVKLSSPGPILFRQARVGIDGQEFAILKFRTMRLSPDGVESNASWAFRAVGQLETAEIMQRDDRRTPIGRLLRRASLDELPQLLNIVKGEMSLIGPRPELPGHVKTFEDHIYRYGDRHRVKSGLTGWAQIHGLRGNTSLAERVEWDNYYVENWSPWLDLQILIRTIPAALRGE
ncbi:MAG: exopolysaccharide biosynthesis polyprenyl glycosylphosphotransferase [Egibacteraceae bacterium]